MVILIRRTLSGISKHSQVTPPKNFYSIIRVIRKAPTDNFVSFLQLFSSVELSFLETNNSVFSLPILSLDIFFQIISD